MYAFVGACVCSSSGSGINNSGSSEDCGAGGIYVLSTPALTAAITAKQTIKSFWKI